MPFDNHFLVFAHPPRDTLLLLVHGPGDWYGGVGYLVVVIAADDAGFVDGQLEYHARGLLALGNKAEHAQGQPFGILVRSVGSDAGL